MSTTSLAILESQKALAPGISRHVVDTRHAQHIGFQWVLETGASQPDAVTFGIYTSLLTSDHRLLAEQDPALNPHWYYQGTAVFDANPGTLPGSGWMTLADNVATTHLVVIQAAVAVSGFSLFLRMNTGSL